MPTLKLTLAYDGTHYAGWQRQGRGSAPTIQGVLEEIAGRILQERVRVIGSGRTDAGAHAQAQVAHLRTRRAIEPARLARSLNQLLPADVVVCRIEPVRDSFHARFDAQRKRYRYRIVTQPAVSPFDQRYVCQVLYPLQVGLMRREAKALVGRHDFRAFARAPGAAPRRGGTRRVIKDASIRRCDGELRIEVEGSGFLHAMVRSIVGTLVDVGRGRRPAGTVRRMLRTGDRRLAGTTAPAKGLTLLWVAYR